jgi:hypothetical protein
MKIAVYTANIGNYRNEFSLSRMNSIVFSDKIDYYFFSDFKVTGCKWKTYQVPLQKQYSFMDAKRTTNKFLKFCLPPELSDYDYVIWCDTKGSSLSMINNINYESVVSLIEREQKQVYLLKHPQHSSPLQEIDKTIRKNYETKTPALTFKKKIQNITFCSHLPDLTTFIRKTDEVTNKVFSDVYDEMIINQLRRDQNIFQYVLHKHNYESTLYYFINGSDVKNKIS